MLDSGCRRFRVPDAIIFVMSLPLDSTRRRFLAVSTAAGLGQTLVPGVLLALSSTASAQSAPLGGVAGNSADKESLQAPISIEMIEQAALIAGVHFSAEQRKVMIEGLTSQREDLIEVRKLSLQNSVAPALIFNPVPPGAKLETARKPAKLSAAPDARVVYKTAGLPSEDGEAKLGRSPLEALAFSTVRELAALLSSKRVTSVGLTTMYLGRLKRLDPQLHCVIALTEERAKKQAEAADREIAAGKYRGPLHGIPWGGKDLLAVAGYPTTWGAAGFEKQTFDYDAEVVKRLDAAGAVLIAKLSMGALAQGDLWFGGRTRNPWNLRQGSSGSSAGSASAVAAGCVGFAIGTETLGSISSPSTRCGATGLRPQLWTGSADRCDGADLVNG